MIEETLFKLVCPSKLCEDLTIESSIEIQGKLEKDPRAVEGGYEVKVDKIYDFQCSQCGLSHRRVSE